MKDFLSERARGIAPYTAGEQPADRRYIKLNTNENPYPPSPEAVAALRGFGAETLNRYPQPCSDRLCQAIAQAEGVAPENVFCSNGSDETLFLSFAAFFDRNAPVCYADITYSFYAVYAAFFGIESAVVPLNKDYKIDLAAMANTPCKGYYIANPNAPTGVGIPRAEMEEFIKSVPDRLVIADEAYMDFYGESLSGAVLKYENLLVVKTFSKSYSLAGIRCGYALGSRALIEGLTRVKDCINSYPVDSVCAAVCAAAVADRAYRDKTARLVCDERERVRAELLSLGFTVPESGANFLFAGKGKIAGGALYARLKEKGVLVRHWDTPALSEFCRITVGTREENNILLKSIKTILG